METVLSLSTDLISCDIETRVNRTNGLLFELLRTYGQLEPITVEGPCPQKGVYYIIDGERRFRLMKKLGAKNIQCEVLRPLTSQIERNKTRLIMQTSQKRITRGDQLLLFEQAGRDEALLATLPAYKRRNITRGIQVPEKVRRTVEKSRASQEALNVIWIDLQVPETYRDELIHRLCAREIGSVHADALKKLVRCPEYDVLTDKQRRYAIEAVIARAKFTENDADQIVIEAMMREEPNPHYIGYWATYLAHQMDSLKRNVHESIGQHAPQSVRDKLGTSIAQLMDRFNQILNSGPARHQTSAEGEPGTLTRKTTLRLIDAARDMQGIRFEKSATVITPRFVPSEAGFRVLFPD